MCSQDDGGVPCRMPFDYIIELVCDWFAAAITYDKKNPGDVFKTEYDWWQLKCVKAKMHPRTKEMVSKILWNFKEYYIHYEELCEMDAKCAEKNTIKTIKSFVRGWKYEYTHRNDYDY